MKELKCPQCGSVFSVDEADYASIVSQVKTQEFDAEIKVRLAEIQKQNEVKQEAESLKLSDANSRKTIREILGYRLKSRGGTIFAFRPAPVFYLQPIPCLFEDERLLVLARFDGIGEDGRLSARPIGGLPPSQEKPGYPQTALSFVFFALFPLPIQERIIPSAVEKHRHTSYDRS